MLLINLPLYSPNNITVSIHIQSTSISRLEENTWYNFIYIYYVYVCIYICMYICIHYHKAQCTINHQKNY